MLVQPKRKSKSVKEKHAKKHERPIVVKKIEVVNNEEGYKVEEVVEDDNSNSKVIPLSRDISIEGQVPLDTQIERGIMNLLEQEMTRDKKQYPPRPQSLSFYEDEYGGDDDLSGQLQALSPAEKQAYVTNRTKFMTINANSVNDENVNEGETGGTNSRGTNDKSRKLSQVGVDGQSLGSSREWIVGDQQKKVKKHKNKKRDDGSGGSSKRTKRRNQSFFNEGYQPKTDITNALEDLQDDVFEGPAPIHGYNYGDSPKSPHYGGISPPLDIPTKIYIEDSNFCPKLDVGMPGRKKLFREESDYTDGCGGDLIPLDIAILLQRLWMSFTTFCHGLLAGVALINMMMLYIFKPIEHEEYIMACIQFSECYKTLFFILCIICVVSVFDRYDLAHLNMKHIIDLWRYRKSCVVIFIYLATLASFLTQTNRTGYYQYLNETEVIKLSSEHVLLHTMGTSIGAVLGWLIISCSTYSDLLGIHLDNMVKYSEHGTPAVTTMHNSK